MLPILLNIGRVVGVGALKNLAKRALSTTPAKVTAGAVGVNVLNDPTPMIEKASHLPEFIYELVTGDEANIYNFVSDEDIQKILQDDIDDDLKKKIQNEVFWDDLKDRIKELPEEQKMLVFDRITKNFFKSKWVENPNKANIDKLYRFLRLFDEGLKGKEGFDTKDLPERLANFYILSKSLDGELTKREIKTIKENIRNVPLVAKQLEDKLTNIHLTDNFVTALYFTSIISGGGAGALKVMGKMPIFRKFLMATSGGTFLTGAGTETLKQVSLENRPLSEVLSDPETYFNLWGVSWATKEVMETKNLVTFAKNPIKYTSERSKLERVKILEGNTVGDFIKNAETLEVDLTKMKQLANVLATLPEDVAKKVQGVGLKPLHQVISESIDLSSTLSKEEKVIANKTLMESMLKLQYHLEDISMTSKAVEELINTKLNKFLEVAKGNFDVIKQDKELKQFFDDIHDNYFVSRLKNTLAGAKKIRLQALHDDNIYKEIDINKISDEEILQIAKEFGDEHGNYRVIGYIPEQTEKNAQYIEKGFNVQRYYVPTNDNFILVKGENDVIYTIPKTYIDNGIIGYTDELGRFVEVKPKEFIVPTDNIFPYLKEVFLSSLEKNVKGLQKALNKLENTEFRAIRVEKIEDLDKVLDKLARNKEELTKRITRLDGKILKDAKVLLDNTPIEYRQKRSKYGFVKLDNLDSDVAKEYLVNKYKNNIAGTSVKIVRDLYRFREYIDKVWGKQLDNKPILKSLAEAIDNYLKSTDTTLGRVHKFTATVGALNTMLNPAIKIANTINGLMTLKMFMPESFKMLRLPEWSVGLKAGVKDWLSISTKEGAGLNKLSMILDPFAILNEGVVIGLIAKASKNPKFVEEAGKLLGLTKKNVEHLLKTEPDKLFRMIYHTISGFNTFALPTRALATGFSKANALINWYPFIVKPFANSLEMIKGVIQAENTALKLRNAGRLAGVSLVGWFTLGSAGVPVFAPAETTLNISGQVAGLVALLTGNETLERYSVDPVSFVMTQTGLDKAKENIGEYFKGLGEVLVGHLIYNELIDEYPVAQEFIQKGAEWIGFALTHDLADIGIASAGAGSFAMDIPLLNLKVINDLVFYFKSKTMGIDLPLTYLLQDIAYLNNIGKYVLGAKDVAGWEVEKSVVHSEIYDLFKEAVGLSYVVGSLMYLGDLATSGYISKVAYNFTKDPDKDKLAFKTKLNSTRDFSKMEEKWDLYAKGIVKLYEADPEGYTLFMNRYVRVNEKMLEKYLKTYTKHGEIDHKTRRKIENSLKFLSIITDKIDDERVRKLYQGYSLLAEKLGIYLNEKDKIKLKGALGGIYNQ